jgi:aspartate/methionine/tyrosine aminotransferase
VTFSARVPSDLAPNRLATTLASLERQGRPVIDLTQSNPTAAGLSYPSDLLAPLAHPRGLGYAPRPLGLPGALEAVSADFSRRGLRVDPERLALTASTSEAYSLLFKVLCDAGDGVLVPRPSYPLFEHLTRLDSIAAVPYDLEYDGRWSINLDSIERLPDARTRAILLVSPNNPTGQIVSAAELEAIAALCAAHDMAIISDEVFADYELGPDSSLETGLLTRRDDVLGFTLGGLSKSVGLPQAKLAWIAMSGGRDCVMEARTRLELVSDTYLSVSTPTQAALGELLERGAGVRGQIRDRVRGNYAVLHGLVAAVPSCQLLRADGGWYAVLRVPSIMSEQDLVVSLLADDGVLTHPGYFFDFPSEAYLILSLLAPPAAFVEGVKRVLRRFDRREES